MVLLVAMVLSVVFGLARGGRFERLAEIGLRHGWIALSALALQVLLVGVASRWTGGGYGWAMLATYGLLLAFVIVNWRIPGIAIVGVGLALNALVMAANGGLMPISPETLAQAGLLHLAPQIMTGTRLLGAKDILMPREQTRLWWLGDALVLPLPAPLGAVLSIGDLILAGGVCIVVVAGMRPKAKRVCGQN
jgi:hypothetical protein